MTKEQFWNWFDSNKGAIEDLVLEKTKSYDIYDSLSGKLKEYSEFLIPELTQDERNQFVLVISCDGVKEGIPYVEDMVSNAETIPNWVVVKYRQPGAMKSIPIKGLNLKRSRIFLTWENKAAQKYWITFYIKGYSPQDSRYEVGAVLHMDHTIGEYNSMMKIEGVEFKKLGLFQSPRNLKTLDDLKTEIERSLV